MIATIAGPSPLWTIVRLFALWKGMLVLVAAGSALVGPVYDTSASLLLAPASNSSSSMFLARLSSWDAVYFVQQAQRGYVFEQEWAFGEGLPRIITRALRGMFFFFVLSVSVGVIHGFVPSHATTTHIHVAGASCISQATPGLICRTPPESILGIIG